MFDSDHKDSGMDFAKGRVDSSDPYTRMPETEQVGSKKRHPLDSDKMEAQRRKLMALYEDELDRQSENRHDQAIDEDFYDNIQWRE